ncbi:hypothetical protein [Saliphagus sp. LR7]|uniref:hypothetical protein n=1 Tax=Saliphagus sp. LR7 TaxID=2282654 RepID=UPI000DF84BB0|nr:hypothetical protein [Saliphagus sp. LR7]
MTTRSVFRTDRAYMDAGAACLFYGAVSRADITDLGGADAVLEGEHVGDRAGSSVSIRQRTITTDTCDGTRYVQFGDDLLHGELSLGDVHRKTSLE